MLSFVLVLARSGTAQAEHGPMLVDVVLVGACARDWTLAERIKAWFAPGGASIQAVPVLDADELLGPRPWPGVRVWCTQPRLALSRLYFVVSTDALPEPRFLVRDVEVTAGLDELGQERVAEVVRAASLALWEGSASTPPEELARSLTEDMRADSDQSARTKPAPPVAVAGRDAGTRPTRPSAPTHPPEPRTTERTRWTFGAALGANAVGRGDEGMTGGPVFELALRFTGAVAVPRLAVGGRYWLPWRANAGPAELRLSGGALRGWLRWTLPIFGRTALETACGAGADWIEYETGSVPTRAWVALQGDGELRPVAAVLLGGSWKLGGAMSLSVAGEGTLQLSRTHYDVEQPRGRQEVSVPWRVQPGIVVLLGYEPNRD